MPSKPVSYFTIVISLFVTCNLAQAIEDCPDEFEGLDCEDVCYMSGRTMIKCELGEYSDDITAVHDPTNGPFIWGTVYHMIGSTDFCCTHDNSALPSAATNLQIYGYDGNDDISLQHSSDNWSEDAWIYGGDDNDTINTSSDTNYSYYVWGGSGDDYLTGVNGRDVLRGEGGEDTIFGAAGSDYLRGGPDNDTIWGGYGNDTIYGDNGNDELYGEGNVDKIYGGPGADSIHGGAEDDVVLIGGDGDDTICGGAGDDYLFGGDDEDYCYGGSGSDDGDCEHEYWPFVCPF